MVTVGGLLYTLGLLLMAFSSSVLILNLSLGLIIGLALSATSFTVLLSSRPSCSTRKRSMAMGIASAAGSFGQFIMLPSTLLLLKTVGWSSALMVSALLIALIIPLAWMLKGPATKPQKQLPNLSSPLNKY